MYIILSKTSDNQFNIFDTEDTSTDVCSIDEIKEYRRLGISLIGLERTNKGFKIIPTNSTGIYFKSGFGNSILKPSTYKYKLREDTVHSIMLDNSLVGFIDYTLSDSYITINYLEVTEDSSAVRKDILQYLFDNYSVKSIYGDSTQSSIGFWKSIGASFASMETEESARNKSVIPSSNILAIEDECGYELGFSLKALAFNRSRS